MDTLLLLAPPFLLGIILVGIHCYLGIHVLARNVLFIDLALAQMAALGGVTALHLFGEEHKVKAYLVSVTFTFIAAAFLAIVRKLKPMMSMEAIIGTLFAFGSATSILLIDKLTHGAEHLKESLVGQLLWVTWADLEHICLIYLAVSFLFWYFRKPLHQASFENKHSMKWDFVFYSLFGIVITSSVFVSGVLLVFSFLVVPALVSSLFFMSFKLRLMFGWIVGSALLFLGLLASYRWDFPAGAAIVTLFTLFALVISILPVRLAGMKK